MFFIVNEIILVTDKTSYRSAIDCGNQLYQWVKIYQKISRK